MSEQQSVIPRSLVLDSSVAVKWYLPEEGHEDAVELLRLAESEELGLLAPSTIYPEFFNALWQQHRRESLPLQELLKDLRGTDYANLASPLRELDNLLS